MRRRHVQMHSCWTLLFALFVVGSFTQGLLAQAPVITTDLTAQTVTMGNTATFAPVVTGYTGVQWYKSTNGGTSYTAISGATSSTYSFTVAPTDNASLFYAAFSNGALTTNTAIAFLDVQLLYVATLAPVSTATNSQGYGSATFLMDTNSNSTYFTSAYGGPYGVLRFSYNNLTTPKIMEHIHGPSDLMNTNPTGILFDIDSPDAPSPTPQPLPNGSYVWVFNPSGTPAPSVNMANFASGVMYINVHTSQYPSGEIKGYFSLTTGSQTFTAPAAPPSITINPPGQYDAGRFLFQAGFGGTQSEINNLKTGSINTWLTTQFAAQVPIAGLGATSYPTFWYSGTTAQYTPSATQANSLSNAYWYYPYGGSSTGLPSYAASTTTTRSSPTGSITNGKAIYTSSSLAQYVYNDTTSPQAPYLYGDFIGPDRITEGWWRAVLGGSDQLRQRVATALSEFFVVSSVCDTIANDPYGLGAYYDMLANDAFTNYRQILYDVTLHPIMGDYLNMRGNIYNAVTAPSPNENYAREIQQLFSIGLYQLNPDGTLILDQNSQPIPTYVQTQITNMAHVMTGWSYGPGYSIPTLPAPTVTGNPVVVQNQSFYHSTPMTLTYTNHSPLAKTLLSYPGALQWNSSTTISDYVTPITIPANSSQSAITANQELNFALDNIFYHPNVGPFFCKALIQRLVTSNPSRGYIYRVVQVFNDAQNLPSNPYTTAHIRGDMKSVLTAIFTDYEARVASQFSGTQYATNLTKGSATLPYINGKQREPIVRLANVLRPLHAYSKSGKWKIGYSDSTLGQTILRSTTVFNFFSPTYASTSTFTVANPNYTGTGDTTDPPTLTLGVSISGNVSPEFDIIDQTTISNAANMLWTGFSSFNGSGTGFMCDAYGSDVYLDYSAAGNNLQSIYGTLGLGQTIQQIAPLLTAAPPDTATVLAINSYIASQNSQTTNNKLAQILHLFACSPAAASQP